MAGRLFQGLEGEPPGEPRIEHGSDRTSPSTKNSGRCGPERVYGLFDKTMD